MLFLCFRNSEFRGELALSTSEFRKHKNNIDTNSPPSETQSQPHRSGRMTKTPKWMDEYVPSETL